MEGLMSFLGLATSGRTVTSTFSGLFDISDTTLILVVGLCFLGTNLVSNITCRNSPVEYATTFSCLFIGALMANALIAEIELPVTSDLAQSAITANIGMTCAALLVMALFGREGHLE